MVQKGNLDQPTVLDTLQWVKSYGISELSTDLHDHMVIHGYMERETQGDDANIVVTEKGIALWQMLSLALLSGPLQSEIDGDFSSMAFHARYEEAKRYDARSMMTGLLTSLLGTDGGSGPEDGSES